MEFSALLKAIKPYVLGWVGHWVYPTSPGWVGTAGAPLPSTAWDGDSRSTTAKTLIDLSTVFGVPAGVKAVDVLVAIRDSGSAAGTAYFLLSPNATASSGKFIGCSGLTNSAFTYGSFTCPCDANGDVYFQCVATGSLTLDVIIQIWGYQL